MGVGDHKAVARDPDYRPIDQLTLQDRLFVMGLLPPGHPLVARRDSPRTWVDTDEMRRLAELERNRAVKYLVLRVGGWDGELDVTVGLFFSVRGRMLYMEFLGLAVPPIRDDFHGVDMVERMSSSVVTRALLTAALGAPRAMASAPVNLLEPVISDWRKQLDIRHELQRLNTRLAFDYGATGSVREFGADWNRTNFFHTRDSERFVKVAERKTIDAVVDVLTEFGFATDDFLTHTTNYINNSMSISNSNISGSSVAMGRGAHAAGGSA